MSSPYKNKTHRVQFELSIYTGVVGIRWRMVDLLRATPLEQSDSLPEAINHQKLCSRDRESLTPFVLDVDWLVQVLKRQLQLLVSPEVLSS